MKKTHKNRLAEYEKDWLLGCSCFHISKRSVFWVSDCGRFIIMKHGGHNDYCGSVMGVRYCEVYYNLYDLEEKFEQIDVWGNNQNSLVKKWEGRWLKKYWEEVDFVVLSLRKTSERIL